MRIGKLSESVLKRSVLKEIQYKKNDIPMGAGISLDCGIMRVPQGHCAAVTTDPITCVQTDMAVFAVNAVVNDLVVTGADPVGIFVTALLPPDYMESQLKLLMRDLNAIAGRMGIQIMGGHTETTTAVNRPVLSMTAVGTAAEDCIYDLRRVKPGLDIVMTKGIGIEATAILAREQKAALEQRFTPAFLRQCAGFIERLSIVPECQIARTMAVAAMHDVSEGGVFGALWEIGACAGVGIEVDLKKIPVWQETIELCEQFDLNPYSVIGGGAALFLTSDGEGLTAAFNAADIRAEIIGRTTAGADRVIINDGERRYLEPPKSDEISKLE